MINSLKKFEKRLVYIEEQFVIYSMLALVLLQILQVLFRYVLSNPLVWIDETSRYLFIWLVMIGAAVAVQWLTHFSVDFVTNKFPKSLQKFNNILITVLTFIFLFVLVYFSFVYLQTTKGQVSPGLGMPIEIPYYAIPVGCTLMIVHSIINVIYSLTGNIEEKKDEVNYI